MGITTGSLSHPQLWAVCAKANCMHTRPWHLQQRQLFHLCQAVQRFVVLELSNYYLDVAKDRLYVRGATSAERRRARGRCRVTML